MRAKRSLGQNFLVDPKLQRKIVDALEPAPADVVVEIGPGHGALTGHLDGRVARLLLVELDDALAAALRARFQGREDVVVVHGDVLAWDPPALTPSGAVLKVVGNIPYNITSPILFRLLEWRPAPARIILMVQKEVADRLVAPPGDRQYGALTVGVRAAARVERLFHVGRGAFRPAPTVDSTVIRIDPAPRRVAGDAAAAAGDGLRSLTRAAFGRRRKQFRNILRSAPDYGLDAAEAEAVLAEVGLRPEDRPEVLDPEGFVELAAALGRRGYPREAGAVE